MLLQLKELSRQKRNKPFTFIVNSIGMILAFTVVTVIFTHAYSEVNHDNDVQHRNRIVRLEISPNWGLTPGPYGPWIASAIPEVEQYCRLCKNELIVRVPEQKDVKEMLVKEDIIIADSSYASMFSLRFVQGGVEDGTDKTILSEQTALKLFGKTNPVGKRLVLNHKIELTVSGIFQDVTHPGLFRPKLIVPVDNPQLWTSQALHFWEGNNFETYLLLKENASPELVYAKFRVLYTEYLKESGGYNTEEKIGARVKESGLQNYTDIYFQPKLIESCNHGNLDNVRVLILIALLVLLVSVINYVNMATAKVAAQSRNIGLKRILGSGRHSLVFSIVFDAVVVCFLSMLAAFFIARFIAGGLEEWTGLSDISDSGWGIGFILLAGVPIVCGILSGLFPALYLTRINNFTTNGKESFTLRRLKSTLMVVQFAISIGLIITTLFIYKQMNYVKTLDLGYDRNNVVVIYGDDHSGLSGKYPEFRNLLFQNPDILKVGISRDPVYNLRYGEFNLKLAGWEGGMIPVVHADIYLPDMLGMEVEEGMGISGQDIQALNGKVLINRQLANAITALQPRQDYLEGERVSVLKDFHYQALYNPVGPAYLRLYSPEQFLKGRGFVYVRLSPESRDETLAYIKTCFNRLLPGELYRYSFMDDDYNRLYGTEELFANRLLVFSALSVVIACLGLLAFVVFFIEQNVKNIGIRKVVGATESQIMRLLNCDFLARLFVGFLISCPVAYSLLSTWLSRFAYKTALSWWVFIAAFVAMCAIALLSVSILTWKAATINPADSLKKTE